MHNAHLRYTYSLIHGLQVCSRCKRSRWYVCPQSKAKTSRISVPFKISWKWVLPTLYVSQYPSGTWGSFHKLHGKKPDAVSEMKLLSVYFAHFFVLCRHSEWKQWPQTSRITLVDIPPIIAYKHIVHSNGISNYCINLHMHEEIATKINAIQWLQTE